VLDLRKRLAQGVDVAALEEDEAREIYWNEYVDAPGFSKIRFDVLQEMVVDSGVHNGTETATRWLQAAAGTTVDGDFGPLTDAAVKRSDPDLLYRDVLADRVSFLGEIIAGDPSQAKYAHGWANRMAGFVRLTP
jgi:lysozyme family protein